MVFVVEIGEEIFVVKSSVAVGGDTELDEYAAKA
jgi:hypothetical protein